ncbi:MAG: C1 family peptidase [Muribaculaceae bacterium]|nr:C1 family peptidase [Muribaculaceae bacterium]
MGASITVWTSSSTRLAEPLVGQAVRHSCGESAPYDMLSLSGHDTAEAAEKINDAFSRLVTLTMTDSSLHILAIIPFFEKDADKQVADLTDACAMVPHKITLHILGLCGNTEKIFESHPATTAEAEKRCKEAQQRLSELCQKSTYTISYSLIDDFASNGAPIGFSLQSLSRYIALIQTALIQDYYAILSPALVSAHTGTNLTVGAASLTLDRDATAGRLLGHGFLAALESVGINQTEVDLQGAAHRAESMLSGISGRYDDLFDKEIRPLYREKGMDEGKAVAEASRIIDADLSALKREVLDILKDPVLTLPEKEAVLAMILGRDNEGLSGMQYEHEGMLLDDACSHPIDLYVDAFNDCCPNSRLLPVRGDFNALKKWKWNEVTLEFEESPENDLALNPIPYIKELKQEILNTTAFIRDKTSELKSLLESKELREEAVQIRKQWHRPEGNFKDIEYKEQPLDDKYVPSPDLKIKDTVDLREYFPPVRNQQSLGSCSSFATAAMYEAMMRRNGVEGDNVMSPAFMFYHSNVVNGRPNGGSNYFDQLEVLGKHGVCYEELFPYTPDTSLWNPSAEAIEDAKEHRALAAKQIPLISGSDKVSALKRNHELLTSALSEGYPVGISLKIYDNLGKDGAFILHPEDAPDAKEDGWHAMVLAGYSEENGFYIVRNSWGSDFGDNGYCYIPSAYIDDTAYLNFACIITEITDDADGKRDIPTVLANFGATETEIRIAAIRNAISKMRTDLKNSQNLYAEYYKYYQRLILQLTIPKVQGEIRRRSEEEQCRNYISVDAKKRELEDNFVASLDQYRSRLKYSIAVLFIAALALGVWWYASDATWAGIASVAAATLGILTMLGYKWWVRMKRRELQEEVEDMAVNSRHQANRLLEMQIKFHVAGMWINRFHKMTLEIGTVYDRLVSFNDTLRGWQSGYERRLGEPYKSEGQMFRSIDTSSLLEGFFEANKERIVSSIDLMKVFDDYTAEIQGLEKSHEQLQGLVLSAVNSLMMDFNIVNFLLGDKFPYASPVTLHEEIGALLAVGQPSYRNHTLNATTPMRILMAKVDRNREAEWEASVMPCFPMRPLQLSLSDPTTLIILTLQPCED